MEPAKQNSFLENYFHVFNNSLTFKGDNDYISPEALRFLVGLEISTNLTTVDLSFSRIDFDLRPLEQITCLEILILDNCCLTDQHDLPAVVSLRTLSLNKNGLKNLELLLDRLKPNQFLLEHLSLLANSLCPHPISRIEQPDENLYQRYRLRVIYRLENLKFLDSRRVDVDEREESRRTGDIALTHSVLSNKNKKVENVDLRAVGVRRQTSSPGDFKIFYPGTEEPDSSLKPKKKKKRTFYGKLRYRYSGKNSEGNRFIKDNDL